MEERGTPGDVRAPASGPAARRSNKNKAPTPPLVTQNREEGPRPPQKLPGIPLIAMEQKENLNDRDLTVTVVLPAGLEKTAVVHGSKPMMDLLVMLCAKYHLNPSSHTIELISTNSKHVKFKPNALIGALEVEKILLKPKGADKNKKIDPQVPEATVRLVINYRRTQKTILRVNPRVPLRELLPAVCEKCEFQQKTTILSRDVQSEEPLDLSKSLNDFGLREVYARDMKENSPVNLRSSAVSQGDKSPESKDKVLKEKENKGLFSMFRRSKKRLDQVATASAPASPILNKQSRTTDTTSAASYSSMPSNVPKKRRAPLPPMLMSQSFPSSLNSQHQTHSPSSGLSQDDQPLPGFSHGFSSELCLRRTKRRAPPPPCVLAADDMQQDTGLNEEGLPQSPLEEIHEQEEVLCSGLLDSTELTDCQGDDSSLNLSADASMDSGKSEPTSDPADIGALSCSPSEVTGEDLTGDLSSDGNSSFDRLPRDPVNDCTEKGLNTEIPGLPQDENTETGVSPAEQTSDQVGRSEENGPLLNEDTKWCQTGICAQNLASPRAPTSEPKTQAVGKQVVDQADSEVSFEDGPEQAEAPVEHRTVFLSGQTLGVHASVRQQSSFSCDETPSVETAVMKKDMATSTEDLILVKDLSTSPQPAEGLHKCPELLTTPTPDYIKESDLKPKPSNELTRDYTPKVGLTTYTIMPQKTLEKMKFFEELTLESSKEEESAASETAAVDHCSQTGLPQLKEDQSKMCGSALGMACELNRSSNKSMESYNSNHSEGSKPQTALGLAVDPHGDDKGSRSSCFSFKGPKAGPVLQMKQKKIPPPTKPKPLSFHLPQHKRTPEHCVTSAAMKNTSVQSPVDSQHEVPDQAAKKMSTSPTELRDEDYTEGCKEPAKVSPTGLSLDKLRSFAAPRPYVPAHPSRFALAVSAAVKRSQSLTHDSSLNAHLAYPTCAHYSMKEIKEPPRSLGTQENEENREALPRDVGHPACGAESTAPMGSDGHQRTQGDPTDM